MGRTTLTREICQNHGKKYSPTTRKLQIVTKVKSVVEQYFVDNLVGILLIIWFAKLLDTAITFF